MSPRRGSGDGDGPFFQGFTPLAKVLRPAGAEGFDIVIRGESPIRLSRPMTIYDGRGSRVGTAHQISMRSPSSQKVGDTYRSFGLGLRQRGIGFDGVGGTRIVRAVHQQVLVLFGNEKRFIDLSILALHTLEVELQVFG